MTFHATSNECEYVYEQGESVQKSIEMHDQFQQHGYIIVRNLFTVKEIDRVHEALMANDTFWASTYGLGEDDGTKFFKGQWKNPGTDIFGRLAGNERTVGVAEHLLNKGELYMYQGKIIMKPPSTGAPLQWHQDYGFWYKNGAPFPHFITCLLALTKSDRENGGLQVIKGSHQCGRIDHTVEHLISKRAKIQTDLARLEMLTDKMHLPIVHANMAPGDCIFFHANTIHRSDHNTSPYKRWNMIFSYNAINNSPFEIHDSACYGEHELVRFDADSILNCEDHMKPMTRNYVNPESNQNMRKTFAIKEERVM